MWYFKSVRFIMQVLNYKGHVFTGKHSIHQSLQTTIMLPVPSNDDIFHFFEILASVVTSVSMHAILCPVRLLMACMMIVEFVFPNHNNYREFAHNRVFPWNVLGSGFSSVIILYNYLTYYSHTIDDRTCMYFPILLWELEYQNKQTQNIIPTVTDKCQW